MINIELNNFVDWIQKQLDEKYSFQTSDLKRLIIAFYNFSMQIMQIYGIIRSKIKGHNGDPSSNKLAIQVIDKSIYILNQMAEKFPNCIDYLFIDNFLQVFQDNLNLLCTLYHSLSHILFAHQYKFKLERDKIIEGINRLYEIHKKIKQLFHEKQAILKHLSHYRSFFGNKVKDIQSHIEKWEKKQNFLEDFQNTAIQFYKSLSDSITKVENQPQVKRNFMKNYFNLMHEMYSAQAKLQILLEPALKFSEDIKLKKRKANFDIQQGAAQFLKWTTILLKHNFSIKHVKKIKIEQITKIIINLMKEKQYPTQMDSVTNVKQIQETIDLVYHIMCQLEKIDQSGILGMISQYKDSIMPVGVKKILPKFIEYQNYKAKYYRIHEQIKMLQKYAQTFLLKETGWFVNITVDKYY